ncbi:HTH-type transcriptional repressor yvoA [Pragia fontium]|uniref:GntR family transcriptional regulator n=1 Tax=Pragia fontium TaxID=82985 RepID=UPI000E045AA6|nr:GntR family transcriptional regulator [Pragia fontium]SUB82828.1 HTH-type transcriptional repressor yvoA [Pragia fontium]
MDNVSTVEVAKEKLDRWLQNGTIIAGAKLPSERELEELLGVKRMTLRQALLNLESESKIFRKDRKGWFVALPRFIYNPKSSASFKLAALEQGREPSWDFIEKSLVSSYPAVVESLLEEGDSGELYRITGWGALDNHKVFYHETFINPRIAQGFIDKLGHDSFSHLWEEEYKKKIVTQRLAFRPIRMSGDVCKIIGGSAGTPAILVEKYRADSNKNIIQIDIEYWRFESVDFLINL